MRRWLLVVGLLVGMLLWSAAPAFADRRKPTITIGEDPNGVAIQIDATRTSSGHSSNGRGGGGGTPCKYELANIGAATADLFKDKPADVGLFSVTCGSHTDVLFLRMGPGGQPVIPGPTVDPRQLALSARDRLPVPSGTIKANPARALTGLATWFWLDGYRGQPLSKTVSEFGVTVQVQARPTAFRWDFGDGATMTSTDLGRAFPQRSTITHTYQAVRAQVTVRCTFDFRVRWRVPGGPWAPMAPISRSATTTLAVAESQSVIGQ
jgi:hypothetical protein